MGIQPFEQNNDDELELEMALWLEHSKSHKSQVYKVLTEHYAAEIIRFFLALLNIDHLEADQINMVVFLAQRTLNKSIERQDDFEGYDSVLNWLFHTAIFVYREEIENIEKNHPDDFSINIQKETKPLSEQESNVISIYKKTSIDHRIPVILRYLYSLSTTTISQILGVRVPTVLSSLQEFRDRYEQSIKSNGLIQQVDTPHGNIKKWIHLSIDGILEYNPKTWIKLERHLSECQKCKSYFQKKVQNEALITSSFTNRFPEVSLDKPGYDQIINAYQVSLSKPDNIFELIKNQKETVFFGMLLLTALLAGYFITRRTAFDAQPIVYPTLTPRVSTAAVQKAADIKVENTLPTPTTITGNFNKTFQLSDDIPGNSNDRNYIYYREPTISGNGRYLIFSSSFTTITSSGPDFDNSLNSFDLVSNQFEEINPDRFEYPLDIWNFAPSVSTDGRFIVYQDVTARPYQNRPDNCNWQTDKVSCLGVYLYDRESGTSIDIQTLFDEINISGPNILPSISPDGRWITFWSAGELFFPESDNLCAEMDPSYYCWNILLLNLETGEIQPLPIGRSLQATTNLNFERLSLSNRGEKIALTIHDDDWIGAELDIKNHTESVVYDRVNKEYLWLNRSTSGSMGDSNSTHGIISANGDFAVFASQAGNLTAGDTNKKMDVFVRDLVEEQTTRISVSSNGSQSMHNSGVYFFNEEKWREILGFSSDGRYVTFMSSSPELDLEHPAECPADSFFACTNIYVYDRETSDTKLGSAGKQRRDSIYLHPTISESGEEIYFAKSDVDCYRAPVCTRILRYFVKSNTEETVIESQLANITDHFQTLEMTPLIYEDMRAVTSLDYSADGTMLASGSNDNSVRIWDTTIYMVKNSMQEHDQLVSDVEFSPNDRFVASASHDGTVRIWDLDTNDVEKLKGLSSAILSLDYSPDGNFLAVGGSNQAWVWNISKKPPQVSHAQEYHGARINSVKYSPDGTLIAHGSSDNTIWIRDSHDGKLLARIGGHSGDILCLAFSANGSFLASGSADGKVNVFKIIRQSGEPIIFKNLLSIQHTDWINDLSFSPDSNNLAVLGFGSEVQFWEIPSGTKAEFSVGTRWYQALSAAFSPVRDEIAVGSSWGGIQLWKGLGG